MNEQVMQMLIPATALISGLIGAYVGLQNRALLAEVRRELAEIENSIIRRINGTYVRSAECKLREDRLHDRLEALADSLRDTREGEYRARQ
jgi:hypothetical protein